MKGVLRMAQEKKPAKKKDKADYVDDLKKAVDAARKAGVTVNADTSYVDDEGVSREGVQ